MDRDQQPVPQTRFSCAAILPAAAAKAVRFINDARQLKPIEADLQVDAQYLLNTINASSIVTFRLTGGVQCRPVMEMKSCVCTKTLVAIMRLIIGYAFGHEIDPHDKCLMQRLLRDSD